LKNGTATPDALAYLWLSIEAGLNIIIAGAPSSGKTTLLSALCAFIPKSKRVITVEEDVNEVKIGEYLPNNVALQGASGDKPIHVNEQIINALHMRPDMLIIGEVRGQETKEVFFGANVGVPFATTMHSNLDSNALINRLISKPMSVEPQSLSALDLAVLMNSSGINGRKVEKIIEYKWLAKGEVDEEGVNHDGYIANEVFSGGNSLETIKKSKVLSKYASATMSSTSAAMKEMKRRAAFLNRLLMQEYESVNAAEYVRSYGVTL
jgi:flagellar protein FlaI